MNIRIKSPGIREERVPGIKVRQGPGPTGHGHAGAGVREARRLPRKASGIL